MGIHELRGKKKTNWSFRFIRALEENEQDTGLEIPGNSKP